MSVWLRSIWESRLGYTESPIESLFLGSFCNMAVGDGYSVKAKSDEPAWVIAVAPQYWISPYRVDFLVSYPFFGQKIEIIVECDGHEFHERTKAQARRDRRRDRELQSHGRKVFRFTGSEIAASSWECASFVLDQIEDFQTGCVVDAFNVGRRAA